MTDPQHVAVLRDILAALREAGVTSATVPTATGPLSVAFGPARSSGETAGSAPAVFQDDTDELPPGAYDVVARAKREGK